MFAGRNTQHGARRHPVPRMFPRMLIVRHPAPASIMAGSPGPTGPGDPDDA